MRPSADSKGDPGSPPAFAGVGRDDGLSFRRRPASARGSGADYPPAALRRLAEAPREAVRPSTGHSALRRSNATLTKGIAADDPTVEKRAGDSIRKSEQRQKGGVEPAAASFTDPVNQEHKLENKRADDRHGVHCSVALEPN
jgi:hypothetical protein